MYIVIDNYDSFTYNLVHYLGELGAELKVWRNDAITPEQVLAHTPEGIILSPGPCDPDKAGICLDLVKTAAPHLPIFGVCLGFQAIGQAFGARVVRAPNMMHGKVSEISHDGSPLFAGIRSPFTATRYHSLMLDPESIPDCLTVTARSADDDLIMGVTHRSLPIYGVQFHPESIASEHGHDLLRNFLTLTGHKKAA